MVTGTGLQQQQLTSRLPHSEWAFLRQLTANMDFINSVSPKISRSDIRWFMIQSTLGFGHRGWVCLFVCFTAFSGKQSFAIFLCYCHLQWIFVFAFFTPSKKMCNRYTKKMCLCGLEILAYESNRKSIAFHVIKRTGGKHLWADHWKKKTLTGPLCSVSRTSSIWLWQLKATAHKHGQICYTASLRITE